MWIARFYVATRFDSMTERQMTYDKALPRQTVMAMVEGRLARLRQNGQNIHPRYDLEQEAPTKATGT